MKLLIDGRTVRPGRTGVGYYTESMIRSLAKVAGPEDAVTAISLFPEEFSPLPEKLTLHRTGVDYERHPMGELYENLCIPRLLHRGSFDVFWGPAFLIPWVNTRAVRAATIHDLTAFSHPECYPRRFAAYMRFVIRRAATHADVLICVSQSVARQVEDLLKPAIPVVAIPAAADPFFHPGGGAEEPRGGAPYLLAIGAGDPRKDTALLLRLYRRMRTLAAGEFPELLLVGEWPEVSPGPGIRVLPRQSREALRALYRNTELFLYPTANEGFGLPVLEAMQCGAPVAASRVGAVPEVAGDAAFLFDHSDEQTVAEALFRLLRDRERLDRMRAAGVRRAAGFSWEKSARELLELLKRTVEQRQP